MKRDTFVFIVDVLIQGKYRFMLVHIYVNSNLVHSTFITLVSVYILYNCKEVCAVLSCKCRKIQCKSYYFTCQHTLFKFLFYFCLSLITSFIDSLGGLHPNSATFQAPLNCLTILSFLCPHQLSQLLCMIITILIFQRESCLSYLRTAIK